MGDLGALRCLKLSENQLTGAIPSSFSSLTNLRCLELRRNMLTGAVHIAMDSIGMPVTKLIL